MKAAYVEGFCDASGIRSGELPDPAPGPGRVLVRVEAVAVKKVDTLVRSGTWRTPVAFPLVVRRDLAGTVVVGGPARMTCIRATECGPTRPTRRSCALPAPPGPTRSSRVASSPASAITPSAG